jgi:hypothetical protein
MSGYLDTFSLVTTFLLNCSFFIQTELNIHHFWTSFHTHGCVNSFPWVLMNKSPNAFLVSFLSDEGLQHKKIAVDCTSLQEEQIHISRQKRLSK